MGTIKVSGIYQTPAFLLPAKESAKPATAIILMLPMVRYSQFRLEKARTEVPIKGPSAFPANLLEFRNPIIRPSKSDTKIEKTNGVMAATMAV